MLPNLIGQTVGKYRIIERLGQGENAVVYKAQQLALNRTVTLKVLEASNREAQERLRRESQVLARFQHPNIRQIYGIETAGPLVFAVLEYADGSLKRELEEHRRQKLPFTRAETEARLRPIADVLDYLHGHGWVHLDVKPENILVTADGRMLLADFGVAQPYGKPQCRGTPAYVAPEVVNGESVGAAADLYSLGVVAYELLALRLPFTGETDLAMMRHHTQTLPARLDTVMPRVSNSAAWVVDRALAKAPHERYATAAGFMDMLQRADTVSVRLPTLPRRRPVATGVAAAGLVIVLGLGGWGAISLLPARPPAATPTSPLPSITVTLAPSALPLPPTLAPPSGTPLPATAPGAVEPTATAAPIAAPSATLAPTLSPAPTPTPGSTDTPQPVGPACTNPGFLAGAAIIEPAAHAVLARGPIVVRGTADLPNSVGYEFRYRGPADAPSSDHVIDGRDGKITNASLGTWNAATLPAGNYLLRLRVKLSDGNYKDCDVPITLK